MVPRSLALGLGLLLAVPTPARSATIRVPGDQPTIQAGINAATHGDTVLVAPGIYTGAGNRNLNLLGKAIVLRSELGPDSTMIACEAQGRGFYFQGGETASTVVEGFTVRNGSVSGSFPSGWGGGILCVGSSPTIRNCIIEYCQTRGQGGGFAFYDSQALVDRCTIRLNSAMQGALGGGAYCHWLASPQFVDCVLRENSGTMGGGIACVAGASPSLERCVLTMNGAGEGAAVYCTEMAAPEFVACEFESNSTSFIGGGVSSYDALPEFSDCWFRQNSAGQGGAIYIRSGALGLGNCVLSGNSASVGGAMYLEAGATPSVSYCVFAHNSASQGGAIYSMATASLDHCTFYGNNAGSGGSSVWVRGGELGIGNSILAFSAAGEAVGCYAGTATLSCSDVYANLGGNWTGCIAEQSGVNGNFSANPRFCDASIGDFTLLAQSPCAPANSPPGCGLIGALPVGCGVVDVAFDDLPPVASHLVVSSNPARSVAEFVLMSAGPGVLDIFDSQGRLVERLTGSDGRWVWTPGASVPAGVYFARVDGGGGGAAVKFVKLK